MLTLFSLGRDLEGRLRGQLAASRAGRAAAAGVVAALAYLGEQELDRRLLNPRSDDLLLLGGMITGNRRLRRPLGLAMHLAAGAAFGIAFDRLGATLLPGPIWARAVAMAQLENAALWPLVAVLDRVHPAVRDGTLAPLNRAVYFVQAALRHLALGAALGVLLDSAQHDGQPTAEDR